MIRIALPNKGGLFEPTINLLKSCGYKAKKPHKTLTCIDQKNGVEFYFLRAGDIPMYVSQGIIDLGITGMDFNAEKGNVAKKVLDLNYGGSRLCAAIPKEHPSNELSAIADLRIATSFPEIVKAHFGRDDLKITELEGAVEISVALGVSDCVVDIVETGTTLKQAGLKILGEPLYHSNAAVFANPAKKDLPEVQRLLKRLEGRMVAQKYMMIEYDSPSEIFEAACQLTPGIASPTITKLHNADWYSVKSMITKEDANQIMDELAEIGCRGIVLASLESARI